MKNVVSTVWGKGGVEHMVQGWKSAFLIEDRGIGLCKGRVAWMALRIGHILLRLEYKTGERSARCPLPGLGGTENWEYQIGKTGQVGLVGKRIVQTRPRRGTAQRIPGIQKRVEILVRRDQASSCFKN